MSEISNQNIPSHIKITFFDLLNHQDKKGRSLSKGAAWLYILLPEQAVFNKDFKKTLSKTLNCELRQLYNYLKELEAHSLIIRKPNNSNPNEGYICFKEPLAVGKITPLINEGQNG